MTVIGLIAFHSTRTNGTQTVLLIVEIVVNHLLTDKEYHADDILNPCILQGIQVVLSKKPQLQYLC